MTRLALVAILDHLYRSHEGQKLIHELEAHLVAEGASPALLPSQRPQEGAHQDRFPGIDTQHADGFVRALENSLQRVVPLPERLEVFRDHLSSTVVGQGARRPTGGALVEMLAAYADDSGVLDVDRASEQLGPLGAFVLRRIAGASATPDPNVHPEAMWGAFSSVATARKVARGLHFDDLEKRMPALSAVLRAFDERVSRPARLAAWIHFLPTNVALLNSFARAGFTMGEVQGKLYSTDPNVQRALDASGVPTTFTDNNQVTVRRADEHGFVQDTEQLPHKTYMVRMLENELRALAPDEKLVIIDDGILGRLLHEHLADQAHRCVLVVQTQNSRNAIRDIELLCPTVNVAETTAKKVLESLMVGTNIVDSIHALLKEAAPDFRIEPRQATIIGYGAVGSATARELRAQGYDVYVYDSSPAALARARADGCFTGDDGDGTSSESRDQVLGHGHLCVVAFPDGAFSEKDFAKLPPEAVVAQAASGHNALGTESAEFREHCLPGCGVGDFGGVTTLRGARVVMGDAHWYDPTRQHVVHVDAQGHKRLILSGGAVVNLRGDIPPEYIQIIRALLLAAGLYGLTLDEPGLHALPPEIEKLIVDVTRRSLAKHGLTLEKPDFSTLPLVMPWARQPKRTAEPEQLSIQEFWQQHLQRNEGTQLGHLAAKLSLTSVLEAPVPEARKDAHQRLVHDFAELRAFGDALATATSCMPSLEQPLPQLSSPFLEFAERTRFECEALLARLGPRFERLADVLVPPTPNSTLLELLHLRIQLQYFSWLAEPIYWRSPDRLSLLLKAWRNSDIWVTPALRYFTRNELVDVPARLPATFPLRRDDADAR